MVVIRPSWVVQGNSRTAASQKEQQGTILVAADDAEWVTHDQLTAFAPQQNVCRWCGSSQLTVGNRFCSIYNPRILLLLLSASFIPDGDG